eukprot:TRINITY_DN12_c0_g1_i1.p1 TRINITY_DN12_c0_g1~~TRINITY_DN12_c0_g1_i1.p1  ORF type:complete len:165 (+),score=34.56 TRINITY_DN12_c0_g1_i1:58-552(+)
MATNNDPSYVHAVTDTVMGTIKENFGYLTQNHDLESSGRQQKLAGQQEKADLGSSSSNNTTGSNDSTESIRAIMNEKPEDSSSSASSSSSSTSNNSGLMGGIERKRDEAIKEQKESFGHAASQSSTAANAVGPQESGKIIGDQSSVSGTVHKPSGDDSYFETNV